VLHCATRLQASSMAQELVQHRHQCSIGPLPVLRCVIDLRACQIPDCYWCHKHHQIEPMGPQLARLFRLLLPRSVVWFAPVTAEGYRFLLSRWVVRFAPVTAEV
jgi:hypothetical protein